MTSLTCRTVVVALTLMCIAISDQRFVPALTYAQGAVLNVMKADFVTTRFIQKDQTSTVLEEETNMIAPDGRYRKERVSNGERTAEIWDARAHKRIALKLDSRRAFVGSTSTVWFPSSLAPRPVPGGLPTGLNTESDRTDLGTRVVAGLTLRGTLFTTTFGRQGVVQFVHTTELWDYRFPDPRIPPIVMEQRFETPDDVTERRIDSLTTVQVPQTIFEIPADFTITEVGK